MELTIKLSEKWETLEGAVNWLAFRAAAELGLGQFDSASEDAEKFQSFARQYDVHDDTIDDLFKAAQARDTNFIYRVADPNDPHWTLFVEPSP